MEYGTRVYYAFCHKRGQSPTDYKKYQRELADKILRYGFRQQFGMEFDWKSVERGVHGKPFWIGEGRRCFNVSNTDGLVVCALSDVEVGVDAEHMRKMGVPVVRRCCSQEEAAYVLGCGQNTEFAGADNLMDAGMGKNSSLERFFQLWTLKESYIKMTGEGMYFPMRDVVFSIQGEEQISCNQPGHFSQKQLGEYWLSLCTGEECRVVWQELEEMIQ